MACAPSTSSKERCHRLLKSLPDDLDVERDASPTRSAGRLVARRWHQWQPRRLRAPPWRSSPRRSLADHGSNFATGQRLAFEQRLRYDRDVGPEIIDYLRSARFHIRQILLGDGVLAVRPRHLGFHLDESRDCRFANPISVRSASARTVQRGC
jgi:hypothetical protein